MKTIKDLKLKENEKVRALTEVEMKKELAAAMKMLFSLSMKLEANELKQTHLVRFARRYIAILRTVANEKGFKIS